MPFAHFCAARNLENRGEGTAWGRRNGDRDFPGQLIPFGCLVDFKPIAPKPRRLEKGGLKNASERDDHHKADEIPTKDHWIFDEESGKLVRVHVEPRTKLLKADVNIDAPIEHIRLTADRDTRVQYDEENGEMLHSVDWRYGPDSAKELKAPWTGESYFTVKPKEFDPLEDSDYEPEGDDEQADDSGPSDHGEDEYSNVPAMPAQKVDPASKAPKLGPVSKP